MQVDLFLAISQGTGLALATGVRPFLPPLVAGALARGDVGLDFNGSDYSFLESIPFLAVMVAIALAATAWERRGRGRALALSVAAVAMVLGALEFAGSLAGEGHRPAAGLAAGAAAALLAYLASTLFLGRARERLVARERPAHQPADSAFNLIGDVAAVCLTLAAIFVPPASYLALLFFAWVLIQARQREARKYEGLRILR
jgi:hypothetical protein